MFFGVLLLDGDAVNVVVGAERDDFEVRRNVVYYAAADAVNVEVVGIHKRHAPEQEDSSADFAKRLI